MLRHIKTTKCSCGALPITERVETYDGKIRTHCNGEQWETREFACGARIEWIPNYSKSFERGHCRNDPTNQNRVATQLAIKKNIEGYIKKQAKKFNLDEDTMLENFSYGLCRLTDLRPNLWEEE